MDTIQSLAWFYLVGEHESVRQDREQSLHRTIQEGGGGQEGNRGDRCQGRRGATPTKLVTDTRNRSKPTRNALKTVFQ